MRKQIVIRIYPQDGKSRAHDVSRYVHTPQEMEDFARECGIKAGDAKQLRLWFCEDRPQEVVKIQDKHGKTTHRVEMRRNHWRHERHAHIASDRLMTDD